MSPRFRPVVVDPAARPIPVAPRMSLPLAFVQRKAFSLAFAPLRASPVAVAPLVSSSDHAFRGVWGSSAAGQKRQFTRLSHAPPRPVAP